MEIFDLNLLRVLVTLDQTRHVGRAAEMLNMSQSGFSTALMRLRRQVDDELFVRSGAGMRPTPRALTLAETARTVLQQVEQDMLGRAVFEPERAEVVFRVSMSDVAEVQFMPNLIRHLAKHAPQASVQVASPSITPLSERLATGEVDLAIGYFPHLEKDTFYKQPLYTHTYACIVRRGHPVLATEITRSAYQLLGHAVVATPARSNALLETALERQRIYRKIVLSTPNHLSLPGIIEQTDLIATVPLGTAIDAARSGSLVVMALPFRPPIFTIYQYWHRRTQKEPRFQWLRKQIKSLFNSETDPYADSRIKLYGNGSHSTTQ